MTLGIISCSLGFFGAFLVGAIYYLMGYVLMFVMPILVFIYGIVGVVKDKGVAMAIVGLNLGLVYIIIMVFGYFRRFM